MIDVQVFGEAGLVAACRGPGGKPAATPFGVVFAPRSPKGTLVAAEIATTAHGTVALRGPMVPRAPFPPGAERSGLPYFKVAPNGFVDTGYACRPDSNAMVVTGPPPGIVEHRRLPFRGARAAGPRELGRGRRRNAGGAARRAGRPSSGRNRRRP